MKKTMLIVWGWKEELILTLPWKTVVHGYELWLADIPNNVEIVANYIQKMVSVKDANFMVFLHESTPHKYNRKDVENLYILCSKFNTQIRIRLFSGGRDRIYFGENNFLGIIGANGSLATEYLEDELSDPIKANLVLDAEKRLINDAHFNHVWNAYWETPKDHICRLAELFNFKVRGYEWKNNNRQGFIEHLRGHSEIWQQLHSFAGIKPSDGTSITNAFLEYNLDAYLSGLGSTRDNQELKSAILSVRMGVKNLLEHGQYNTEPCQETASISYNALFDLFKKIDQNDHE